MPVLFCFQSLFLSDQDLTPFFFSSSFSILSPSAPGKIIGDSKHVISWGTSLIIHEWDNRLKETLAYSGRGPAVAEYHQRGFTCDQRHHGYLKWTSHLTLTCPLCPHQCFAVLKISCQCLLKDLKDNSCCNFTYFLLSLLIMESLQFAALLQLHSASQKGAHCFRNPLKTACTDTAAFANVVYHADQCRYCNFH